MVVPITAVGVAVDRVGGDMGVVDAMYKVVCIFQ